MRMRMLLTALLTLSLAGTASAQQLDLQMNGQWFSNRGPLIDIPQNGGPQFVSPGTQFTCSVQTGCLARFQPANGGVPGSQPDALITANLTAPTINAAATKPATIRLDPLVFGQNSAMAQSTGLVLIVPTVVQLQTNFQVAAPGTEIANPFTSIPGVDRAVGPSAVNTQAKTSAFFATPGGMTVIPGFTTTTMISTTTMLVNTTIQGADSPDRILRADAWTNQTGRLSPQFAFCPGPVNNQGGGNFTAVPASAAVQKAGFVVNCANSDAATGPGAYNGIVNYSGNGANNFGGTMSIMLDGSGFVSVILNPIPGINTPGAQPPGDPNKRILAHQPIGAPGAAGLRFQVEGGGYAVLNSAFLQSGPANLGFSSDIPNSEIGTIGPEINTANGFAFTVAIPPDRNLNWGFPHTTGRVSVMNVETNNGQPGTTTLVATGADNRDAFGRGNITLVSGGTSYRVFAQQSFGALNVVNMTFTPEPRASLMLGASLLAIGGLFVAIRRRHAADTTEE